MEYGSPIGHGLHDRCYDQLNAAKEQRDSALLQIDDIKARWDQAVAVSNRCARERDDALRLIEAFQKDCDCGDPICCLRHRQAKIREYTEKRICDCGDPGCNKMYDHRKD